MDAKDPARFERLMIAVDNNATSEQSMKVGATLAERLGATVGLVHVVDLSKGFTPELGFSDDRMIAEMRVAGAELLGRSAAAMPAGLHVFKIEKDGDPATEIVAAADDWEADIIVMGAHARGPLARFLLGSTAEAVVRRAHCPVLTVGSRPSQDAVAAKGDCHEVAR